MNKLGLTILGLMILVLPYLAHANAIPEMVEKYKVEGASNFSAKDGQALWNKKFKAEDGTSRSCATCHNSDVTISGAHKKTGRLIAPMALSVNAEKFWASARLKQADVKVPKTIERFSKTKKIRKWFKRNCKWTYGRECTPQEKGNFLMFLQSK